MASNDLVITKKTWDAYISKLSAVNSEAASKMRTYLSTHQWWASEEAKKAAINYAYALTTKYGEAGATLAAEMYDAVIDGALAAVPADVASYGEVAKAVQGTMKSGNIEMIAGSVERLVKMASADTTIKNAIRDEVEWAWIPSGDSCAFCLTLASRGWQNASKRVIKGDHADHIHAHCDCTFAIRKDERTKYPGYDPDKYLEMYQDADGAKPNEKINSMRRQMYARNKDEINEQKRAAYAAKHND